MTNYLNNFKSDKKRLYHGSCLNFNELLSSDQCGNIRSGEENRRAFKNVVFLTDNFQKACEYAGNNGVIYVVIANAIQYAPVACLILNAKKAKSVENDIYIAKSNDINIISKWHKSGDKKRNCSQKYIMEYIGEQE